MPNWRRIPDAYSDSNFFQFIAFSVHVKTNNLIPSPGFSITTMPRILTVLTVFALVALSAVPAVTAHPGKVGVLRHFASLPAGLSGEGLIIRDGHFYVSTISFAAKDGTILVLDRDGNITET